MCGIAGIVRFDEQVVAAPPLEHACSILRHRGPDDRGVWLEPGSASRIGLGAARLAIMDPTPAGHQPMTLAQGRFVLVFNGELYNYREVRRVLASFGEEFKTESDAEVALAACVRWGVDAHDRFNGIWAFAFFDTHSRMGFLSRDPFGVKPLFYSQNERRLIFASELRALRVLDSFDDSIDGDALVEHLQFGYISGQKTIFRGASRLLPGHVLRFTECAAAKPQPYYELPNGTRRRDASYAEACQEVRRLTHEAVAAQRVCDVPIGAFLSGGVDSSIVAAHLSAAGGRPIDTFSLGFADEGLFDERAFARRVANHLGTRHHEIVLTHRDVLDGIPRILDHLGEPVGDSSIIPTSLLSQFTRSEVTVALSGDGSDELFGGYWRYLGHDCLRAFHSLPRPLRFVARSLLARRVGRSKSRVLGDRLRQLDKLLRAESADPIKAHLAWSRILAPSAVSIFAEPSLSRLCEDAAYAVANASAAVQDSQQALNRILAFDLRHQLPADMLQKVDLASMMHSLEVRVPFLDRRLVEFVLPLPAKFKIHGGLRKRVLIDAHRDLLPGEVVERPKRGFEVPFGEYLRGPLLDLFHDVVTPSTTAIGGILNYSAVHGVLEDHLARREDHSDLLFAMLSFCWWARLAKRA